MQANNKKEYKSPYLTIVEIDNIVSMQMVSESETDPPGQPNLSGSASSTEQSAQEETLQKSSFDDNPFRR